MTLTHPLISKHSIVRALRPENTHLDLKLPEMEFLQGERSIFYTRLCKKANKWPTHHCPRLFYRQLQPPPCTEKQSGGPTHLSLSTGSCNRHHALSGRAVEPPTSPFLPFVLVQNLSSKRIMPTDNMQPKLG